MKVDILQVSETRKSVTGHFRVLQRIPFLELCLKPNPPESFMRAIEGAIESKVSKITQEALADGRPYVIFFSPLRRLDSNTHIDLFREGCILVADPEFARVGEFVWGPAIHSTSEAFQCQQYVLFGVDNREFRRTTLPTSKDESLVCWERVQ